MSWAQHMDYLSEDQLRKLNAQRRKALLKKVYSRIGQCVDPYVDYELDQLNPEDRELCEYKILIRGLILELD